MNANNTTVLSSGKRIRDFKKNLPLLILALPGLMCLILFRYFPMFGLILPFKNYEYSKGLFGSGWSGLKNFEYLFKSRDVLSATMNTITYNLLFISLGTVIGLILALMLYELTAAQVKIYQTVLYLPYFISWVVVAYIVNARFDMDFGYFNKILAYFGKETVMWYAEPDKWPPTIVLANLWKGMGNGALMYYAALIGISPEYYEAARIDGAGKLKQIFCISLPMIKNVIIVLCIINVGKIMHADFGLFYNLPMNSSVLYSKTDVLDTYVYRALMTMNDVGMSSAASFYQAVVGFILVVATNLIVKKIDPDSGLF